MSRIRSMFRATLRWRDRQMRRFAGTVFFTRCALVATLLVVIADPHGCVLALQCAWQSRGLRGPLKAVDIRESAIHETGHVLIGRILFPNVPFMGAAVLTRESPKRLGGWTSLELTASAPFRTPGSREFIAALAVLEAGHAAEALADGSMGCAEFSRAITFELDPDTENALEVIRLAHGFRYAPYWRDVPLLIGMNVHYPDEVKARAILAIARRVAYGTLAANRALSDRLVARMLRSPEMFGHRYLSSRIIDPIIKDAHPKSYICQD